MNSTRNCTSTMVASLLVFVLGLSNETAQSQIAPPRSGQEKTGPVRDDSRKTGKGNDKKKAGDDEHDRDREDLAGRLIRKSVTESDEGLMDNVLRLMDETAHRMEIDFDSGSRTQELQKQISDKLDEAIKIAAAQRRPQKQNNSSASSDRRRGPNNAKSPTGKQGAPTAAAKAKESSTDESNAPSGAQGPAESARGEIRDLRRGWGQLPERQRDEVIQGSGEGYLERYRQWIEKYYRALQESGQ
ncbi:MAG: hypothetical protein HYR83_12295 [Planctomycetes bacterium]|nr:hypothetical protein [Planctomycetota bacterium]